MPDTVRLRGLAELERALSELPDRIERNIVRGALRAAGQVVEAEAKRQVPVKSGALRDSIRTSTRIVAGRPVAYVRAGGNKKGQPFYAHLVEFGTGAHFIKAGPGEALFVGGKLRKGVQHKGATRKPFMRPAMDASAQAALRAFGEYIRKRLSKQGIDTPELEPEDA